MSAPSTNSHVPTAMTSILRSTATPPRPASIKPATPPSSAAHYDKPPSGAASGPAAPNPKNKDEDLAMASPPPPPKLPEVPVSPKSLAASPTSTLNQAPAQLALMLSSALSDVDALKKALADEKRRAARAERLVESFHPNPNAENGISGERKTEQIPESAVKAILEAEARAERAERLRDDALHAVHSLSTHFAELERYESSLSLRASDARGAFTRLLTNITTAHPPPASSPTLSGSPPALALPALPPPLPAPSTNVSSSQYLSGPGAPPPPPSSSSTRYTRGLPSHAPSSFSYPSQSSHSRQTSHTATFNTLALPPPPSATGLGSGLIGALSAPPQSSSSSFSVPAKRSHRSRSVRGPDDGAGDSSAWDDSKRRRVGPWDMDVDEPHASQVEHPLPYPQHQPPLSAQPTQRLYDRDRDRDRIQPQQSYARNGAPYPETNGTSAASVNGMVRVDARELVRDAKERERRERGLHYQRREGDTPRRRRRSASRSSVGSSWSIDEMLLETATDGGREKREDGRPSPVGAPQEQAGPGHYAPHVYAQTNTAPALSTSQIRDEPPYAEHASKKGGSHSSQASIGSVAGVNGAPSNEREKSGKVPATQLVTLGPGGIHVSGGGQAAAPIPGGGFPAHNAAGQRICRQCGVPGRYKDGKCVEKWGPGPEGPGTVCDRCRKKMKRVERRGTLDGAAAAAQHQAFLALRQSQAQLQAQPTLPLAPSQPPSHGRSRGPMRTDTLLLDPLSQSQTTQGLSPRSSQQHAYSRERERGRGDALSRSHSPVPAYQPSASASATVRHGHAYSQSQSQGQSQVHRRAPTPPYITSISTRDQDDDGDADDDVDENGRDVRDGHGELDVDAEIARAAEVENGPGSKSRDASRSAAAYSSSSGSSNASLAAPNGSGYPPKSRSRASSTSTMAPYERKGDLKKPSSRLSAANGKHTMPMPLPSVATLPRAARRRDMQDELDEDDGDGDADADADGSAGDAADPDAEIMDAVDAAMKVEE